MERLHSLDALRGIMMLLGIVLHAIVSYAVFPHGSAWPLSFGEYPVNASWPYQDPQGSFFFDVLYDFIHVFRMPLFFLLSGFFSHMLLTKRGSNEFVESRKKRILYPLLVFWPIVFPLVGGGIVFLMGGKQTQIVNESNIASILSPLHLWFLYYLLYFYVAYLSLEKVLNKWSSLKQFSENAFSKLFSSPLALFTFSIPLAFLLYANGGKIAAASTFIPSLGGLCAYFLFFLCGRYVYSSDKVLHFKKFWQIHLAVGLLLFVDLQLMKNLVNSQQILRASIEGALCTWCFVYFWMGLFLSFFNRQTKVLTYLAESSYWLYLVHLPLVIALVALFKNLDFLAFLKASAVLLIAFILLIPSYEFFVRRTFIGRFLSGRKST